MKALALLALLAAPARANEPTGRDVEGAPLPGEESGRVDERDDGDSTARELGRGLLFVPRAAFELAFAPLRGGVWAYERFQLKDRWFAMFFTDARTVGFDPTLAYDSYAGFLVGARFVARDLFGAHEHLAVRAATGGEDRDVVTGAVRSGDRLGRITVEATGEHDRRPHETYYGIGNASDLAIVYRQQLRRAAAVVDARVVGDLHVRGAGAVTSLVLEGRDAMLADYRTGYGELELAWDSRGRSTHWEPSSLASIGSLLAVYGGRLAIADAPDGWRAGGELQHFLRITSGPRVLATRLHVEGVSGTDLPFHELAKLGGSARLRGYATDRYRDRLAMLGTLEYRWDLARYVVAATFVDAGRVAPAVAQLAEGDLHVGYGLGVEGYTERSFVLRATVASSIDGGVFFTLAFDPAFELDPRVERR